MDKAASAYYILRCESSDSRHGAGERIAASKAVIRIGEQEDCDLRFENRSGCADELFAIVRPCRSGEGWQLIPCSEAVPVSVNGTRVELVHYLSDGDRIGFGSSDRELVFNVRCDEKYDVAAGAVHIVPPVSRRVVMLLVLIPLVLFGILGVSVLRIGNADRRRLAALERVRPSVVRICVDSVFYVERTSAGDRVLRSVSLADNGGIIGGTAFITDDSLLVTARHCVEPWLNDAQMMTPDDVAEPQWLPARWALEAETYNQTHGGDTVYMVVSSCSTEPSGRRLRSSEFAFDTSRDDIVDCGDFFCDRYWRSVQARRGNQDMMLGDIAVAGYGEAGTVALAADDELETLLQAETRLDFMGYPDYQTMTLEHSEGRVMQGFVHGGMIVHNGSDLKHGYSGGPVLTVSGGRVCAVGVISVVDRNGGSRTYSVPVSERVKVKRR